MKAKLINEKFTEKSDPIQDMGIGLKYNIDFFYFDHPSINGSYVNYFIRNLKSAIKNINPDVEYEIRMHDFSDGAINFKGGSLLKEEMLDKLKEAREKSFESNRNNLCSWNFGKISNGFDYRGKIYDVTEKIKKN